MYKKKSYKNVIFLRSTKTHGKLTVFRLTADNRLKKEVKQKFKINNRKQVKLKVNTTDKKIIATVGTGFDKVKTKFKLTKKGKLNPL